MVRLRLQIEKDIEQRLDQLSALRWCENPAESRLMCSRLGAR